MTGREPSDAVPAQGRASAPLRRLGLVLLCIVLGLAVWPSRIESHFAHVLDAVEHWGPAVAAALAVGLLSRRDWVQRIVALSMGECLALELLTDLQGTRYLFLILPLLLLLANAVIVLGAASVLGVRAGLRG